MAQIPFKLTTMGNKIIILKDVPHDDFTIYLVKSTSSFYIHVKKVKKKSKKNVHFTTEIDVTRKYKLTIPIKK